MNLCGIKEGLGQKCAFSQETGSALDSVLGDGGAVREGGDYAKGLGPTRILRKIACFCPASSAISFAATKGLAKTRGENLV